MVETRVAEMKTTLTITKSQYDELEHHLFPGDNKEAISFALCGFRIGTEKSRFVVHKLIHIPYDSCPIRSDVQITWNTDLLAPLFDKAAKDKFTILKIHSHPNSVNYFSDTDDESDQIFSDSFFTWTDITDVPVISAIILKNRKIIARCIYPEKSDDCTFVEIVGDDIEFHLSDDKTIPIPEAMISHGQAFGSGTFNILSNLSIAVIGCSGLGSPVVEQLARLGVGELVLVDPDIIEKRNLNRIINSTDEDARKRIPKVDVMKRAIDALKFGTTVKTFVKDLDDLEVIESVALCDVAFGCVDGLTGRNLLNKISTYYSIPFFDTGVKLEADGKGNVDQVVGTVNYFQPGLSSFFTRNIFSPQALSVESIKKNDPEHYADLLKEKYIKGVVEHRLAVISVNMLFAALVINEFLARIHKFRLDDNSNFSYHMLSLSHSVYDHGPESQNCPSLKNKTGLGDKNPMLGMPKYSFVIR